MTRVEFMTELAALLQDVPEYERVDAMKYYNDYFDDAGEENEQEVIRELESPEKVAANIKADIGRQAEDTVENPVMEYSQGAKESGKTEREGYEYQYQDQGQDTKQNDVKKSKTLKILLIIAIILVASPVLIPVILGIAALILGCLAAVFCIFIAIVVTFAAIAVTGVVLICSGIISMVPTIAVGLALFGTGLILTVIGVIGTIAGIRLCTIVFPGIIRGIVWLCRLPFHRKAVA